jgi:chloramphenicol-sensitive protein RarD
LWGIFPLYWALMASVDSLSILGYRFIWSLVFMVFVLLIKRDWAKTFFAEAKVFIRDKKLIFSVIVCGILIAINWGTYIVAIAANLVSEASLGYFLNPLLNFVLAMIFLKEKATKTSIVAMILSFIGVAVITYDKGVVPWVSLILASSFAVYGLIKKNINLQAYTSLTLETIIITPFAVVFLMFFSKEGMMPTGVPMSLLAIGGGIITAVPLLLFSEAAKRISYIAISFVQFASPTISFLLSVFFFKEPCPPGKLLGFAIIWAGLIVFSLGSLPKVKTDSTNDIT